MASRVFGLKELPDFDGSLHFFEFVLFKYYSSTLVLLPRATADQLCILAQTFYIYVQREQEATGFLFLWYHKRFSSCASDTETIWSVQIFWNSPNLIPEKKTENCGVFLWFSQDRLSSLSYGFFPSQLQKCGCCILNWTHKQSQAQMFCYTWCSFA